MMAKNVKTQKINLNFFIKMMIVIVIVFCVINTIRLRTTYNDQQKTERDLIQQKIRYQEEIDRIKEELEHEMDGDYIMRIAREKLNYYLPDEILFYSDR
ncbi:MAG: septum formation initiator family protein [Clostridia bacterium]|nr:septum formation initiator family protein [Clostridia bacterium]